MPGDLDGNKLAGPAPPRYGSGPTGPRVARWTAPPDLMAGGFFRKQVHDLFQGAFPSMFAANRDGGVESKFVDQADSHLTLGLAGVFAFLQLHHRHIGSPYGHVLMDATVSGVGALCFRVRAAPP